MQNGNIFIMVGVGLVVVGIFYKYGLLGWFGNLPGDFKSQGENVSFFMPITSMIIVSVVLSLLIRLFGK